MPSALSPTWTALLIGGSLAAGVSLAAVVALLVQQRRERAEWQALQATVEMGGAPKRGSQVGGVRR